MKLYVANSTKQNHQFWYSVPGQPGQRMQPIRAGGQTLISGDLQPEEAQAIIHHHERYGLIKVDEIDRVRAFNGLCYSIDKPVPANKIEKLFVHNQDILERRAEEKLLATALASNQLLETKVGEAASDAGRSLPGLGELEISISEESIHGSPSKTEFFRSGNKGANGIRMSRSGDEDLPRGGRRGRRRAA